jgi:hypothetical protein
MERLLAKVRKFQEETLAEIKTNQLVMREKMDSVKEKVIAKMNARQERMEASMNACREGNKACLKKTAVCLERKEPTPEDMANVAAHLENSNGATREETVWATDHRSRDRRLAVRHRRQPKKRTHGDGGSRQNLAAARERLTRRAIPVPQKGHSRVRSGKDDVRGAPKGRTFVKRSRTKPRRKNGIRDEGLKQLRLGSKGNINEIFRDNLGLEITKRIAGTSVMIRKISVKTL